MSGNVQKCPEMSGVGAAGGGGSTNQNDRVGNIRERPPIRMTALGISVNHRQSEGPRWEYP
eukprot:1091434-Prorocentrum_minimum.AAC.1